jgi:hypothetical protein
MNHFQTKDARLSSQMCPFGPMECPFSVELNHLCGWNSIFGAEFDFYGRTVLHSPSLNRLTEKNSENTVFCAALYLLFKLKLR